jgi:hypothetical protein
MRHPIYTYTHCAAETKDLCRAGLIVSPFAVMVCVHVFRLLFQIN